MFYVIVGLVLILFGVAAMFRRAPAPQGVQSGRAAVIGQILGGSLLGVVLIIAGLATLASTSFVLIAADRVGHLKRVYLADDLPAGRIIALPGQKAPRPRSSAPASTSARC